MLLNTPVFDGRFGGSLPEHICCRVVPPRSRTSRNGGEEAQRPRANRLGIVGGSSNAGPSMPKSEQLRRNGETQVRDARLPELRTRIAGNQQPHLWTSDLWDLTVIP